MTYDPSQLKDDILEVLQSSLSSSKDVLVKYKDELEDIAKTTVTYAMAASANGDNAEAKNIFDLLKARSLVVAALIAHEEQSIAADTIWKIIEAVARFAGLIIKAV